VRARDAYESAPVAEFLGSTSAEENNQYAFESVAEPILLELESQLTTLERRTKKQHRQHQHQHQLHPTNYNAASRSRYAAPDFEQAELQLEPKQHQTKHTKVHKATQHAQPAVKSSHKTQNDMEVNGVVDSVLDTINNYSPFDLRQHFADSTSTKTEPETIARKRKRQSQ
jgi:hypothetical protein